MRSSIQSGYSPSSSRSVVMEEAQISLITRDPVVSTVEARKAAKPSCVFSYSGVYWLVMMYSSLPMNA